MIYFLLGAILLISTILSYQHQYYFLILLALALIVISFSFINFKYLWYLGFLGMPISLQLHELVGTASLTVPSDLIVAGFSLLLLIKSPSYKEDFQKIFSHPITVAFTLYFIWMCITSLFAELPVVALKFTLNTYWYASTYFFWTILFLKNNKKDFYNWLYIILLPICFVVIFTMIKHGLRGFTRQSSYYIMQPFYKEHTAYAASIAVLIPFYYILSIYGNFQKWAKVLFFTAFTILFLGLITSYTRGAWLGLLMAIITFWSLRFWGFTRVIIPFSLPIIAGILIFFGADVFFSFSNTGNTASQGLTKHLKSIVNLRTDESNKERINRWVAARGMLEDRPLTGFGP
ncbi:MAG: O-antigen ligase family protein, partial [Candidatus Pacearchaeota archaeon]